MAVIGNLLSNTGKKHQENRVWTVREHSPTVAATSYKDPTKIVSRKERKNMKNEEWAIRKLTPTECMMLQAFTTEDVEKCRAVGVSDSQLYKQAGNSITVNVIELLAEHLFKAQYDSAFICTDEEYWRGE